ncbi:diaminopimelate epimerase [Paenibacillus arenilitoris]|uniref:Diaminopimelate epimerase n=1 Tax=Paenibacillus arenilitoris TaxID=2772299 RepID=A0A927CJ97_9BACL|nr:diaminopimelate epimerase [Paenibacillus arenilitoris]MBD2868485.1 diaminopimelate epimerase [Paenibacillus arenilitoris]
MIQEVDFVKCCPANNMTILVMSELPAEQRSRIASQMMNYGHLYAEQVGFVEKPARPGFAAKLHMAGGEFCGNASLALAASLASERSLSTGESMQLTLIVSGSEHPVSCRVQKLDKDYWCEAGMPVPISAETAVIPFEGALLELGIVRYGGSFHLIIDIERFGIERAAAERLAKLLGIASGANLVGVMLYRPSAGEMAPLIFIPSLDSLVWEQGCGSGTASLGCYLAWIARAAIDTPVRQPGGIIQVSVSWDSESIGGVTIGTAVGIVARGKAYVEGTVHYSMQGGL